MNFKAEEHQICNSKPPKINKDGTDWEALGQIVNNRLWIVTFRDIARLKDYKTDSLSLLITLKQIQG